MSRLKPTDILDNGGNYHGFSRRELIVMAEHYGFRTEGRRDGPHQVYRHRDYHDLTFRMPHGSGEAEGIYAEVIAKACREVKRRNQAIKDTIKTDPIPDWLRQARPPGKAFDNGNNMLGVRTFTQDGEESFSPVCNYTVSWRPTEKGHDLVIANHDIPGLEKRLSFGVGSRERAEVVKHAFTEFDTTVRLAIANRYYDFYRRCANLQKHHGFKIDEDHSSAEPQLHISHPAYGIAQDIPAFGPHQYIPDDMLVLLDSCKQCAEETYLAELGRAESLKAHGWETGHDPATGEHVFTHKGDKREVRVPTYGTLGFFKYPDLDLPVEAAPTAGETPVPTLQDDGNGRERSGLGEAAVPPIAENVLTRSRARRTAPPATAPTRS